MAKSPGPSSSAWETQLSAARLSERSGRPEEAARRYRQAVAARPGGREARMDFARFLELRGKFREAAVHVARALELGGPRAELLLASGRLHEKQGLLRQAKAYYRRSAEAAPDWEQPAWETARVLERIGDLRNAAAWYRRLCRRGGALEGRARLALGWLRWEQGRRREAESDFRRAAATTDGALPDWPRIFSALLCAGRYRAAFRLGEEMLKRSVKLSNSNCFQWPWWYDPATMRRARRQQFVASELRRLRQAEKGGGFAHWFAYCRGPLLGRRREFDAAYARIKRLPARYSCLQHPFVLRLLDWSDYDRVIAACRKVSRRMPGYWGFRCRAAEAYLMKGEAARGLREFARIQESVDASAKPAVMTWHAEARLWLGDYRKAVELLDRALSLGAPEWAQGWRGAACLKLGRPGRALADLDRALELQPEDDEARVWRGEAYRILGRQAEALRDLDLVIRRCPDYVWARCNRALARRALGDERGMAEDFHAIPTKVRAAMQERLGLPWPKTLSPDDMAAVLRSGLDRAKGVRRPESYLDPLWMSGKHPRR
ncbi:MAG: tetratricopeptide repeat protein [Elusimicrobia bacterium]|nr:tetratricopeptide repeat protein [Elusimicrobiota bacterium]